MRDLRGGGSRLLFDSIDRLALAFLLFGGGLLIWGTLLDPPDTVRAFVLLHFADWTPGLMTDGLLLLVVNHILRTHERRRVVAQVASLSNEFALDAVRRVRQEGWYADGTMEGSDLERARLRDADLSGARLAGSDLTSADLRGASLHHVDLRGANLTAANLRGADLRWADLRDARLRWADLRDALLDGALTENADLRGAALDPRSAVLLGRPADDREALLSDREVVLLREGMERIEAVGAPAIEDFYTRLFAADPRLRGLFPTDLGQQSRKFLHSLGMIVEALDAPDRHMPILRKLGARHAGYGVRPEHFTIVTGVLMDVLEAHIGDAFTNESRRAWEKGLRFIAGAMIEAGGMGEAGGGDGSRDAGVRAGSGPEPRRAGVGDGA